MYNAAGEKIQRKKTDGSVITVTDYLDGFQYNKSLLEFFPHAEGYVKATVVGLNPSNPDYAFNYVYNYTDHLGNIRLSYTKDPQTGKLKILDENHFYPFGLKHNKTSSFTIVSPNFVDVIVAPVANNPYDYRFQGQELQDDHDLNWYSYRFRNYDPAIGRFFNVDPLTEEYHDWGEYVFSGNRVVDSFELEGLEPVHSGEAYGVKTTDEYGWEWVSDGEQWGIELGTATLSGSVTPALSGNFLSRFRDKTSSWSEKHLREPISRWTDNNIRQPVSGWIDYNIRRPATELTQPLKNHLNLSPEQWEAHKQLMIEWGVEAEKEKLRSTMTAFGESGLLSGSGVWGGNLGRVYNSAKLPETLGNTTTALVNKYPSIAEVAGTTERTFLMPGQVIDRYGPLGGKWFSTPGTSYGARSIPPGLSPYTQFKVLKPFEVQKSLSSPGMFSSQTGFGIQFQSPVGANTLIKRGIIIPIK